MTADDNNNDLGPSGYPVFDLPRPDVDPATGGARFVRFETEVTMRVDVTGELVTMPLRAVFTAAGWSFEIGPYSVAGEEACDLAAALVHYGRMSTDFAQHEVVDL